MKYDITFHPSWWHENAGVDFTQEFFDDPEYRMDCDVKMRRTLYERFGEYGLGEKDPRSVPFWERTFWRQAIFCLNSWAVKSGMSRIIRPRSSA